MPILNADLIGQCQERVNANVLLDSGAQTTIISEAVSERLALEGKKLSMTITKVRGEEALIKTKLYRVKVAAPGEGKVHAIQAVGLP